MYCSNVSATMKIAVQHNRMLRHVTVGELAVAICAIGAMVTTTASPLDDDVTANAQVSRCAASAKAHLEREIAKLNACTAVAFTCSVDLFKTTMALTKLQCYDEDPRSSFREVGGNLAAQVVCPGDGKDLSLTREFVSRLCYVDPFYHPEDYFKFGVSIRQLPKQQFLSGFDTAKNAAETTPPKPEKVAETMAAWALDLQAEPYNCKHMTILCTNAALGLTRSLFRGNDCQLKKNDKRLKNPLVVVVLKTREGRSNASFNTIPVAHDYKKSNRSDRLSKIINVMDSLNCDNDEITNKPNLRFQEYAKHLQEMAAKL